MCFLNRNSIKTSSHHLTRLAEFDPVLHFPASPSLSSKPDWGDVSRVFCRQIQTSFAFAAGSFTLLLCHKQDAVPVATPCPWAALVAQWEHNKSRGSPVSAPGIVHTWLNPLSACSHTASSPASALLCKHPVFATPASEIQPWLQLLPTAEPRAAPMQGAQCPWALTLPHSYSLLPGKPAVIPERTAGMTLSAGNMTAGLLLFHGMTSSSTLCKHE